ncbi:hypothetical protein ACGVWS_10720 [Enterobacteriaceae bacterium LUAb1]
MNSDEVSILDADSETTKILIAQGVNVNTLSLHGENALFYTDYEKANILIEAGIDCNHTDYYGRNALFRSDAFGSGCELSELLISSGLNVNQCATDSYRGLHKGNTPLFHSNPDKAKLLREHGADL